MYTALYCCNTLTCIYSYRMHIHAYTVYTACIYTVSYLRRLFSDQTYQDCRNMLGKYGLEGHAHTIPIRDLSG